MANTARGYPYPLSSDPVAQGATAIQNLAQAVNDRAGVAASGTVTIQVTTANTAASVSVVFPAGRFTAAPVVLTTLQAGTNPFNNASNAGNVTANGATIYANGTASGGKAVGWLAVQV